MTEVRKAALGRLSPVALREVWPHEALDFTPWLLANADALGEALDMDLELTAHEHPIGGFSLDLIGTDQRSNEMVIIENQLETTDHRHLGQLLTYAGGTDPVNVVWVAAFFRDEHRAALEWLNQRTDPNTRFFGVEVTAVRIGDSPPAPLFRVVAQPNDWGKQIRTRTQVQDGASNLGLQYLSFWERYLDALRGAALNWTSARKGGSENWLPTPTGVTGAQYITSFTRRGLLSEIFFNNSDPTVNQTRYTALESRRAELVAAYGTTLLFEPLEGRKGCRIGEIRPGTIAETSAWPEYIEWFIDTQKRLRAAIDVVGGVPGSR